MKPVCPALPVKYFLATIMAASSFVISAHAQQRQIVKLHPTPENIPQVTDPRFILHEEPGRTFMDETTHEKITIGVEDGEYHEMFGAVYDLALPGDGTILVLDSENREIRVFDYDGDCFPSLVGPEKDRANSAMILGSSLCPIRANPCLYSVSLALPSRPLTASIGRPTRQEHTLIQVWWHLQVAR